ncbi:cytochrome P450 [Patescibacteria group bacterium]|nr:cytochrome P450 [Patescibacteria group bacterium]MBU1885429.1 cytochrome P450 [Patescibacteria group bacterium]
MFDTKLSFTLYDVIGHVIPGIFVLILTVWVFGIVLPEQAIVLTTIGVVVGYIIGHIFHAISSWILQKIWWIPTTLSKPIDRTIATMRSIFLVQVRGSSQELKSQIKQELVRTGLAQKNAKIDELELYDYCSNVLLESGFIDGRDILESKEAFYRSLIPTTIYSAVITSIQPPAPIFENKLLIAISTVLIVEFLFYRREYYRRIKNNQVYKQALIKLRNM